MTDTLADAISAMVARLEAAAMGEPLPPIPSLATAETLGATLGLGLFERSLLVLCAAAEMDPRARAACATLGGTGGVTPRVALQTLEGGTFAHLAPVGPLRRYRLVTVGEGPWADAPLRISESVLHALDGNPYLDAPLLARFERVPSASAPLGEPGTAIVRLVELLGRGVSPVSLVGPGERTAALTAAATQLGLQLWRLAGSELPDDPAERADIAWRWEAAALQHGLILTVEGPLSAATLGFVRRLGTPVVVSAPEIPSDLSWPRIEVPLPSNDEQLALWNLNLGERASRFDGHVPAVASQFQLTPSAIHRISLDVSPDQPQDLWRACRGAARESLEDLAGRIEAEARWSDLVLPDPQMATLRQMSAQLRNRARVYDQWGFRRKSQRGLGITALFAGPSGTGKTMAAEVLAHEFDLDLFRIDLSGIVSKYIGETEKNLKRIFDAAERAGAVLLFDEADALFGKRGEVKDSHDRYANIEVGYLLQRMEAYRGLAVLTTNFRSALDDAFLRRIRFVVEFPFPDEQMRAEIWRSVLPAALPRETLDYRRMATWPLSGGNIRSVAVNAAFHAAEDGGALRMSHLARAARDELRKLGLPGRVGDA